MDWFILIVVFPLILVPIVLLYGFAGCGSFDAAPAATIAPPSGLAATGVDETRIDLAWQHPSPAGVSFTLARKKVSQANFDENYRAGLLGTSFQDSPIPAGTYSYKVRALLSGAPSAWSDEAMASTLSWKQAYFNTGVPSLPSGSYAGRTLVQKMDPNFLIPLITSGKKVRITLFNGSAAPLNIQRAYVSAPALAGATDNPTPDPWDSRDPLVPLFEGGKVIPANTEAVLESAAMTVVTSEPLLISFDIVSGSVTRWTNNVGASIAYDRGNLTEAKSPNRSPNYSDRPNTVFLIKRIEVLN